jgi:hypothetical protein
MSPEEFEKLVSQRIEMCKAILASREQDYSGGGDRLQNFKEAATLLGCEPEQALLGFMAKHIVALAKYVRELGASADLDRCPAQWDEKICDIHNYLFLLSALLQERYTRMLAGAAAPKTSDSVLGGGGTDARAA